MSIRFICAISECVGGRCSREFQAIPADSAFPASLELPPRRIISQSDWIIPHRRPLASIGPVKNGQFGNPTAAKRIPMPFIALRPSIGLPRTP
ncbi:MAG: hypothetical protein ACKVS9_20170 [Phycisphaerae bacterium]